MNIRTRILLGYGYLVALLVLSAAGASVGFQQFGGQVQAILDDNVRSVRAATEMLQALERQDSAVLAVLLGRESASAELVDSERAFGVALDEANANVTEPNEAPVIDDVRRLFREYREARDSLLSSPSSDLVSVYEDDVVPKFSAVKSRVFDLLELNHAAMEAADTRARARARKSAAFHGLLVILALVSLVVLSRELRRQVVSRLAELELVATHLSRGDRRRRASEAEGDELGMLARELNRALDSLDSLKASNTGFQQQQRQLLLSVLLKVPGPAAILAPSGARIASTLDQDLDRDLDAASGTLGDLDPDEARQLPIEIGGSPFSLEPLATPQGRITGWLVRRSPPN